jgi:predicted DNA-binding transcriptional regulator AlpA
MDSLIIIEGYERSGKSNLAQAIAEMYINTPPYTHKLLPEQKLELTQKAFIFDRETFGERIYELPRGSPIIVDEGATTLFAKDAMEKGSREAEQLLTVMGERNLFTIICAPSFFSLLPYVRNHRAQTLIRVVHRGRYFVYNKHALGGIQRDSKSGQIKYPAPTAKGNWSRVTGALWDSYEAMKSDYLKKRVMRGADKLIGVSKVREITGLSFSQIYRMCEDGRLSYVEIGDVEHGQKKFRESDIAAMLTEHPKKY